MLMRCYGEWKMAWTLLFAVNPNAHCEYLVFLRVSRIVCTLNHGNEKMIRCSVTDRQETDANPAQTNISWKKENIKFHKVYGSVYREDGCAACNSTSAAQIIFLFTVQRDPAIIIHVPDSLSRSASNTQCSICGKCCECEAQDFA